MRTRDRAPLRRGVLRSIESEIRPGRSRWQTPLVPPSTAREGVSEAVAALLAAVRSMRPAQSTKISTPPNADVPPSARDHVRPRLRQPKAQGAAHPVGRRPQGAAAHETSVPPRTTATRPSKRSDAVMAPRPPGHTTLRVRPSCQPHRGRSPPGKAARSIERLPRPRPLSVTTGRMERLVGPH
jgi:hypothetical protein